MPSKLPYVAKAPTGWLVIAFLGIGVYLATWVIQLFFLQTVADFLGLTLVGLAGYLSIASGLGSLLILSGLIAALWRANVAAGLSGASGLGLALGIAGVGILFAFEVALVLDFFDLEKGLSATLLNVRRAFSGDALGNVLAFAGLAALAVGLARAVRLFGRRSPEAKPTGPGENASPRA